MEILGLYLEEVTMNRERFFCVKCGEVKDEESYYSLIGPQGQRTNYKYCKSCAVKLRLEVSKKS